MNLNELDATPFNDGVDVANLPAQMGAQEPPPQPGPFVFVLPKTLSLANFDTIAPDPAKPGDVPRLRVKFDDQAPLVIIQAHHLESARVNTPFKTTISNKPRKRGKADDPNAPVAADWDYLNQALKVTQRPVGNRGYATQLITDAQAAKTFAADVEWSWSCNPDRPARFPDGKGGTQVVQEAPGVDKKGCGERYYQNDIDKGADGKFPLTISCSCGAQVRAFGNLARFRETHVTAAPATA